MKSDHAGIEVTDDFNRFAPHLFHMGLDWAYRVRVGGEEVIGATGSRAAAWQQARAMKKNLKDMQRGCLTVMFKTFRITRHADEASDALGR